MEALLLLDDAGEPTLGSTILHQVEEAIYNRLVRERQLHLKDLKARLRADVDDPDLQVVNDYAVVPVLHVRIKSAKALDKLIRHGKVLSIDENARNELFLTQSLPLIGQPTVWDNGNGDGGAGATIAVLDTGVDYTRAAFGACTAPAVPGACKVVYARDFAPADGALDSKGHGTNVAGIALGVAPAARIAALDVFRADGYAYTSDIIAALDWCVANKATYNIAAINMSLGSGRYYSMKAPTDSWGTAIKRAVDAGIVVTAASGNEGFRDSLSLPAAYSNVVSVGAVYDANLGWVRWSTCSDMSTAAGKVICFSNSASFLTLLAPGANIQAAGISMGGTSQAAPHTAGAVAVLRSTFPAESVAQIVTRLQQGPLVTDSRNGISKPRLDLIAAMDVELSPPPPPPPPPVPPTPPPIATQSVQLSASSYRVSEGNGSVTLSITRTGGTAGTVSVRYATVNSTAVAGADYAAASGTITLPDGVSSGNLTISLVNDALFENEESFQVVLSDPQGAVLGTVVRATVTITDNDSIDRSIIFAATSVSVNEGAGNAILWVKRLGDPGISASIRYATSNNTAIASSDYTSKSGILTWAAGDAADKSITVPILNDRSREFSETFRVSLSSPTGAALGVNNTTTVTIIDND